MKAKCANSYRLLFFGSIAVTVGVVLAVTRPWSSPRRPDIQRFGGTVLVYETESTTSLSDPDMTRLVETVQMRFGSLRHISVKPEGDHAVRVEIPMQEGINHAADVERTRRIMTQRATLQFRIVANWHDDEQGITAAREMYQLEEVKRRALQLAGAGSPPESPPLLQEERGFKCRTCPDRPVTYSWFRITTEDWTDLGFSLTPGDQQALADAREKGETYLVEVSDREASYLLYAREEAEARGRAPVYYVLCQNPVPCRTGEPGVPDGSCVHSVQLANWDGESKCVVLQFTARGAAIVEDLTSRNVHSDGVRGRRLATILNG